MKGKTPAEIAQENFNRAERFATQKQWAPAKTAYELVAGTKEAAPDLRKRSTDGVKKASDHLTEEALWTRAQEAHHNNYNNHDADAKTFAKQVVDMKLDHRSDAEKLIKQVDTELIAETEASADEKTFTDLKQQFAKSVNNADELKALVPQFGAIAARGGKHAEEAREIGNKRIPDALTEINARSRREQQEKLWSQLVGEYETALQPDNRAERQSVRDRLSQFLNGPHAPEAQQNVKHLDDLINAQPPQPPNPPSPPPVDSSVSANAEIRQIFSQLSDAFGSRHATSLSNLFQRLDKTTLDAY